MEETEKTVNQSNYQETPEQFTHISYSETPEQSNSESYVEVPAATVSSSASEVSPVQNDEPSRENHIIDGDLTVQNNVSIGGTLRAKRIVHPWGCLFHTLDSLKTEFPKPFPGMWAIVGSTFPFDVYRCRITGEWELVMPCSLRIQIERYLTENKYATQEWVLGEIGKIKIPKSLTIGDVSNYLIENKYLKEGDITIGSGGDATKEWVQQQNYLPRVEFDDLFEKVALSGGGYAIRAKYALYSNQWISCLGPNPDAGAITAGATTLGGLNNVTELADSIAAADKVLVLRAGASGWTLANLSDIVGLDTTALSLYLNQHNYVTTSDLPDLSDYLLKATFDDLFEKVTLSSGQTAIRAKYAFYTNEWMSCLGANPDAGTVQLGATTLGGLNNVVAAADEVSAAAKVLVREAGASSWSLKNLSDIVGLDTTALATYLSNNHYAKTSDIPSLAGYATREWVQQQGYQPAGDYATNSALTSAINSLNTAIGAKLDASVFDDLFVKESDGNGGYRIKAKYALYSNQYLSCLGNNPDAGTVALGATTLGGLNNVVAAADEATAAAKVLVREAGSAQWTLKNLSDIVGLDTSALATYLSNNGYATQQWVQLQGYLTEHQSLEDYAKKTWVQAQGYLTAITKAQVEAVLTGDITTHTHSQYLTSALAAQTYQPKGDYALTSALNSAVSSLNTAIGKKLDAATFDDLFVKESDGNGGYRIRAKYAFYSNLYISCLGNNPNAGTSPGGGVDLDAVAEYLQQQGYATQDWVQQQGYLKAADLSAYALSEDAYLKNQQNRKSNAHTVASLTAVANSSDSWINNFSLSLVNNNNALNFYVGGVQNERQALIQSGHNSNGYAQVLGVLHLNKLGGAVYINNSLALNAANVGTYAVTLDTEQEITGKKHFTAYETEMGSRVCSSGSFDSFANYPHYMWHVANQNWTKAVMDLSGHIHFVDGGASGFASYKSIKALAFVVSGGSSSQFLKADGSVDSNTYLTAHQPLNYINVQDTRGAATNTSGDRMLTAHFKANGAIGLSDGGLYAGLLHLQPWADASGGSAYELGFTVNGNLWLRSGAIGSAWGAWRKLLDTNNYTSVLDSRYVNASGDTMTGYLYLGSTSAHIFADTTYGAWLQYGSDYINIRNGELWKNNATRYWHAGNDGHNSGLDADLLDGLHSSSFMGIASATWTNGETVVAWAKRLGWAKPTIYGESNWGWAHAKTLTLGGYSIDSQRYAALDFRAGNLNEAWKQKAIMFLPTHSDANMIYIAQMTCGGTAGEVSLNAVQRYATYDTILASNVASATKLQTARSLWGNSFDGTGDISGNINLTANHSKIGLNISDQANDCPWYGLRLSCAEGWHVMLSGYYGTSLRSAGGMLSLAQSGNVGIGTTTPAYKLHVVGDIMADGWVRTTGVHGWYNQTYGGGWYQANAVWISAYNKPVHIAYTTTEGANSFGVGLRCYHASHTSVEVQGGSYTMGLGCHSNGSWYWWRGTSSGKSYVMQYDGTTWSFTGVIKTSTGMYSDGYMSCLGQNTGSDMRLKHIIGDVTLSLDMIADAPAKLFRWRYGEFAGRLAVGSIAQYWQQWLSPVVSKRPDDYLQMDYGVTALTATINLARIVRDGLTDHERRILALENENKALKSKINELERRLAA